MTACRVCRAEIAQRFVGPMVQRMTPEQRATWKKDWAARLTRPTPARFPAMPFHRHG